MSEINIKFEATNDDNLKHEDAFKAANLFAGKVVNLTEVIQNSTPLTAPFMIEQAQKIYELAFEAFIAGVDYGRTNPKEPAT